MVIHGEGFAFTVRLKGASRATMARTLLERGDPRLMFEAECVLRWEAGGGYRLECPCGEVEVGEGETLPGAPLLSVALSSTV